MEIIGTLRKLGKNNLSKIYQVHFGVVTFL